MEYNLIIKPKAQQDIRDAIDWYKKQNTDLSEKLLISIDESFKKIQVNPEYYQKRYLEIRIVFTKIFRYGIFYTIEDNTIYVHAILHTKQDPKIAEKRVQ